MRGAPALKLQNVVSTEGNWIQRYESSFIRVTRRSLPVWNRLDTFLRTMQACSFWRAGFANASPSRGSDMKTWPQAILLSPSQRVGTISQNNSRHCHLPQGAFHWEDHPLHKAYSYILGFGLGNKEPVCTSYLFIYTNLLCFLIYFLGWVFGAQANAKGLTSPAHQGLSSCAIPACWSARQGSSPAEK